jgi:hypothetical protein
MISFLLAISDICKHQDQNEKEVISFADSRKWLFDKERFEYLKNHCKFSSFYQHSADE